MAHPSRLTDRSSGGKGPRRPRGGAGVPARVRAQRGRGDKDPAKRWTRWEAAVSAVGEAEPIADAIAAVADDAAAAAAHALSFRRHVPPVRRRRWPRRPADGRVREMREARAAPASRRVRPDHGVGGHALLDRGDNVRRQAASGRTRLPSSPEHGAVGGQQLRVPAGTAAATQRVRAPPVRAPPPRGGRLLFRPTLGPTFSPTVSPSSSPSISPAGFSHRLNKLPSRLISDRRGGCFYVCFSSREEADLAAGPNRP